MADTKISDLSAATTLAATDLFVIAQEDTANKKVTAANGASSLAVLAFLGARVFHNANQSIASATPTALALNSERFDTDTIHDTVTNNSRLTVPASQGGKYAIGANIEWEAGGVATGLRQVGIRLNGTSTLAIQTLQGNGSLRINLNTIYDLAAADYVEIVVYQDSGSPLNIVASSNFSPEFWIHKIG